MATNPTIPFKEQIEQTEKLETVYRNVSKELQKVVDLSYEELDNEINLSACSSSGKVRSISLLAL